MVEVSETKPVKFASNEGELFSVDDETLSLCSTVKNMLKGKTTFRNSLGGQFSVEGNYVILKKESRILASVNEKETEVVITLPDVPTAILSKVLEYCAMHTNPALSEREKKAWDAAYVQVKQSTLCELASAAYYLDIKPLVNLTSRAIATHISGKTSEEIRDTFCHLNYDVYAPVFATTLATRCRLQKKITQKKQNEGNSPKVSVQDSRPVEELLDFINNTSASNNSSETKNKKKKKKKSKSLDTPVETVIQKEISEIDDNDSIIKETHSPGLGDEEQWDLDPKLEEELDREVEEFRKRLESIHTEKKSTVEPKRAAPSLSSLVGVH